MPTPRDTHKGSNCDARTNLPVCVGQLVRASKIEPSVHSVLCVWVPWCATTTKIRLSYDSCDTVDSKARTLSESAMARTRDIVFDGHSDLSMRCHAWGGQSGIEVVSFWDSNTRQVSVFSTPFTSLSLSTTNLPTDSTSLALTLIMMSQSPEIMCTS
jgi:hypothetical protein